MCLASELGFVPFMLTRTISLCLYTVLSGTCRFPEFSLRITEVPAGPERGDPLSSLDV